MKNMKKIISVFIAVLMLISCVSASFTVNASTGTLCDKYATNPQGKVGAKGTITIDGDFSDWSSDMLIAQGAAWDVANHYKGGHENCVLDTYQLYAAWDNDNLYVGWQMVNTTDTWAREGDGPLSDGGRVLDVPLILALSVDPSSTSMSNKNTSGGSIWGNKMGITFNQHVDRLFYMSGKPGLGTPAMFTAVDAQGNTNYTDGCKVFSSNGIEYNMAEGNISDSIYGLNYSEDPSDVYSNDADWVDYKTFIGSSGAHNTKYDSFYEMKIPFSTLGVDSSYIENNGIGAMLLATRGESGLDCIPFDDTMLDNATGSYASDASTSHEKDDEDVITSEFARIGNLGGSTPSTTSVVSTTAQTTTAAATTQATTVAAEPTQATTQASSAYLNVNATSNFFPSATKSYSIDDKQVTVSYKLNSSLNLINSDWTLKYDTSKLSFNSANINGLMPKVSSAVIFEKEKGTIKGNFSDISLVDFTSESDFVSVTFDIVGGGDTAVDLNVNFLGVAYKDSKDAPVPAYVVDFGSVKDVTSISGFENETYAVNTVFDSQSDVPTTTPSSDKLKINATSNLFAPVSQEFSKDTQTVTVKYKLTSAMQLVNSQWTLTYDSSKLTLDSSNTAKTVMPNIESGYINKKLTDKVKGDFTNLDLYDFSTEKDFVTVKFNVVGTGETTVNLDVETLGVAYKDSDDNTVIDYPVKKSQLVDITSTPGFENSSLSGITVFDGAVDPTTDTLKVNATSNFFTAASKEYSKDHKTVTVSYKLTSSVDIVNSQWTLTYDSTKLSVASAKMPNIPGATVNTKLTDTIKGDFTNIEPYDFKTEKDFIKVTFDIIGTGETTVDLNVYILGVGYKDSDDHTVIAYPVDKNQIVDVTSKAGFENLKMSAITVFDDSETEILYGDANLDGEVDVNDATLIQKYGIDLVTLNDEQKLRADVNFDGEVDINDATLIQKYLSDIISSFK